MEERMYRLKDMHLFTFPPKIKRCLFVLIYLIRLKALKEVLKIPKFFTQVIKSAITPLNRYYKV